MRPAVGRSTPRDLIGPPSTNGTAPATEAGGVVDDNLLPHTVNQMERSEVEERLQLLQKSRWPVDEIVEFYGYPESFLDDRGLVEDDEVDRYELEQRVILDAGLLSTRYAASKVSLTEETLHDLLEFSKRELSAEFTPFPVREVDSELIVNGDSLENWFREILESQKLWSSLSQRTQGIVERLRELHAEHDVEDEYTIDTLDDVVSTNHLDCMEAIEGWNIDAPVVASTYCAISDAPISLGHSETLLFRGGGAKPVRLPREQVGWHVLLEHRFLKSHTTGSLERFETFATACGDSDE